MFLQTPLLWLLAFGFHISHFPFRELDFNEYNWTQQMYTIVLDLQ